jgi:hypothetical protein
MRAATDILSERLKRLGYAPNFQVRLYGEIFDLTSDPIISSDKLVFIDGVEQKSGRKRRIRIPLSILQMAQEKVA